MAKYRAPAGLESPAGSKRSGTGREAQNLRHESGAGRPTVRRCKMPRAGSVHFAWFLARLRDANDTAVSDLLCFYRRSAHPNLEHSNYSKPTSAVPVWQRKVLAVQTSGRSNAETAGGFNPISAEHGERTEPPLASARILPKKRYEKVTIVCLANRIV